MNAVGFGLSTLLRFYDEKVRIFLSGALAILLYAALYLAIGCLCLVFVAKIDLISNNFNTLLLKLITSIGTGFSWTAIITQIGLIFGLIRRVKVKKS